MVKHIILWTLKSEYSAEEKEKISLQKNSVKKRIVDDKKG